MGRVLGLEAVQPMNESKMIDLSAFLMLLKLRCFLLFERFLAFELLLREDTRVGLGAFWNWCKA